MSSLAGTMPSPDFSPREREVLASLCDGETYPSIARRLGISRHTVATYVRRLRSKTGAVSRAQRVVAAVRCGVFDVHAQANRS